MSGNMEIKTYCNGPEYLVGRDITKGEFLRALEEINENLTFQMYGHFEPEPISEGGIVFKYNDDVDDGIIRGKYKSMRLRVPNWPWIGAGVMREWENNNDVLIKDNIAQGASTTFLKAFRGAPEWTDDELGIVLNELEKIGLMFERNFRIDPPSEENPLVPRSAMDTINKQVEQKMKEIDEADNPDAALQKFAEEMEEDRKKIVKDLFIKKGVTKINIIRKKE